MIKRFEISKPKFVKICFIPNIKDLGAKRQISCNNAKSLLSISQVDSDLAKSVFGLLRPNLNVSLVGPLDYSEFSIIRQCRLL